MTAPLLQIQSLSRTFIVRGPGLRNLTLRAVDDVSFEVAPAKTVALVGESGCGKSTTGKAALRLIEPTSGSVHFDGIDLLTLGRRDLRRIRARMQAVFQDPRGQLDPRMLVGDSIAEGLRAHGIGDRSSRRRRVQAVLDLVGLPSQFAQRYPRELSGGQRQRVGIARAIAPEPKLILLDESVSALDVSIQTQVLNLLQSLREQLGLSYLFISHGLAAVRYVADTVVVMYLGRSVETAPAAEFFAAPAHPYSAALLSAVPRVHASTTREQIVLRGDVPSPFDGRVGCVFAARCPLVQQVCRVERPPAVPIGPGRSVECHFPLVAAERSPRTPTE
jgi:oligopeptide/dipeptide ABC transporter ATP-binding protein